MLFLTVNVTFAQLSLKGFVTDQNGEAIPYAHITLEGLKGKGTISNADGRFSFYLNLDIATLKISALGYASKSINVTRSQANLEIVLEESAQELEAVTVVSRDYARELVEKAVEKIPENYPEESEMLTVFLREKAFADKQKTTAYYLNEVLMHARKETYDKPHRKHEGEMKVLESRKVEFEAIDSLHIRFYGEVHGPQTADFVARRSSALSLAKKYTYDILDTLFWDGEPIYKVSFDSKNSGRGSLLINGVDFGILKIIIHKQHHDFDFIDNQYEALFGFYRESNRTQNEYLKDERGVYRKYQVNFEGERKRKIILDNEYVVTGYESTEDKIPFEDRYAFRDPMMVKVDQYYDSSYWLHQNTFLMDSASQKQFARMPVRSSALSFSEKMIKWASRYSNEVGISTYQIPGMPHVSYAPLEIDHRDAAQSAGMQLGLMMNFSYQLTDHWGIVYNLKTSFAKNQYDSEMIGVRYSIIDNRKKRFGFNTELCVGVIDFGTKLGNFATTEAVKASHKKIDASAVDVYYIDRRWALAPSANFLFRKSTKTYFNLNVGYFFDFDQKDRLYLRETGQPFWKTRTAIEKSGIITSQPATLTPANRLTVTISVGWSML